MSCVSYQIKVIHDLFLLSLVVWVANFKMQMSVKNLETDDQMGNR